MHVSSAYLAASAPADTMTLLTMPMVAQEETEQENDDSADAAELRLLLFPSQVSDTQSYRNTA